MKEVTVYSLGEPPAFTKTTTDDMYWTERANYEYSMQRYLMNQQSMKLRDDEASDFNAMEESFDTWIISFKAWLDAVGKGEKSNLPALPDITDVVAWISGQGWIVFAIKLAINIGLHWLERYLDSDDVDETAVNLQELIDMLRDAFFVQNAQEEWVAVLPQLWHDSQTIEFTDSNMRIRVAPFMNSIEAILNPPEE